MADTWESRDLLVLKAAVELYDEKGRSPRASDLERATGFDKDTVQRALRALYSEPFFEQGVESSGNQIIIVGEPTSAALRVVGQWPTPESQLERLVAALQAAADDEDRPEEDRSKFKQAILTLRGAAWQVALGALSGAGGNLMTGG
ncbi:hypothetical protein [Mycolicibacterium sp. CR10]|uniref:hypothetical protein n=1 Tax=Mycolicibacterium sp. CR10 TaxID=2562314 RepID=UPI0010BF8B75|nr:hypothetical protein [Mycolicibacterium sp. CR10]